MSNDKKQCEDDDEDENDYEVGADAFVAADLFF